MPVYRHTISVQYRYGRNPYSYWQVQFFVWQMAVIYVGCNCVWVQWPALDVNDIPADSIMRIRGSPLHGSGRKISEAKNECPDTFYDPCCLTALRHQDNIVHMPMCVVSKYLIPDSTEDCPCVSESDTNHVGDN